MKKKLIGNMKQVILGKLYTMNKKLQDKLFNKTANNTSSITKTISDYIEDPFKKNK